MILGDFNTNTFGVTQGGAIYSLADVAIGYRILDQLKEKQKVFTLEMKINFIKKGKGAKLAAKTELFHWGRQTVVIQCQILDENGEIVAHSLGTFYIVDDERIDS